MNPVLYRTLQRIATNTGVAIPSYSEPFGSTVWLRFFESLARATAS